MQIVSHSNPDDQRDAGQAAGTQCGGRGARARSLRLTCNLAVLDERYWDV
jgi:hypothetical protein